jgi:hypothetical protein
MTMLHILDTSKDLSNRDLATQQRADGSWELVDSEEVVIVCAAETEDEVVAYAERCGGRVST